MRFSKPNEGLVGRMNLMQLRMMRKGLKKEIETNLGLVILTEVPGISVKKLAVKEAEKEFWLTGEDIVLNIQVTYVKEEIEAMLNKMTLKMDQRDVWKLSNSNRWVALITCGCRSDREKLIPECG